MLPSAASPLPCATGCRAEPWPLCTGWKAEEGWKDLAEVLGAGLSLSTAGLLKALLVVEPMSLLLLLPLDCCFGDNLSLLTPAMLVITFSLGSSSCEAVILGTPISKSLPITTFSGIEMQHNLIKEKDKNNNWTNSRILHIPSSLSSSSYSLVAVTGTQLSPNTSCLKWITWAQVLRGGSANWSHGDIGWELSTSTALFVHELCKERISCIQITAGLKVFAHKYVLKCISEKVICLQLLRTYTF
ncbi:hypothetical protein QQP08_004083 [Theobroma cacao]|nr:hypothetical protein QQP08_004083 [Theobroma cacao]